MKVVSGGGRRFGIADKVFVESFCQLCTSTYVVLFNAELSILNFMRSSFKTNFLF